MRAKTKQRRGKCSVWTTQNSAMRDNDNSHTLSNSCCLHSQVCQLCVFALFFTRTHSNPKHTTDHVDLHACADVMSVDFFANRLPPFDNENTNNGDAPFSPDALVRYGLCVCVRARVYVYINIFMYFYLYKCVCVCVLIVA